MSDLDFEELITPNLISHYSSEQEVCVEQLQTKEYELVHDDAGSDAGYKYKIHLLPSADECPPPSSDLAVDGEDPLLNLLQRHLCVTCVDCGETFETEARLQRHVRVHAQRRRHKTKAELKAMTTTDGDMCAVTTVMHADNLQFHCAVCGKVCASERGLHVHISAIHEREREQFACDVCGRICASAFGLSRHRSTHNRSAS